MIISNNQLNELQGGVENQFIDRLVEFAKEHLTDHIDPNEIGLLESIKKIVEVGKEFDIITEINLVRLMVICFEKKVQIPFEPHNLLILENPDWDQDKKIEELFFILYSGIIGLKEVLI